MLDLPILTLNCCSGHPDGANPYLNLVFRDREFGKQFYRRLKYYLQKNNFQPLEIGHPVFCFFQGDGFLGPNLPAAVCMDCSLPFFLGWEPKSAEDLQLLWYTISVTLDIFDKRGVRMIDLEEFEKRQRGGVPKSFERVYTDLVIGK